MSEYIDIQFFLWLWVLRNIPVVLIWFCELFIFNLDLILGRLPVRPDFQIYIIWCFIHKRISGRFNVSYLGVSSTFVEWLLSRDEASWFSTKLLVHLIVFIIFLYLAWRALELNFWRDTCKLLTCIFLLGFFINFDCTKWMILLWLQHAILTVLHDLILEWFSN